MAKQKTPAGPRSGLGNLKNAPKKVVDRMRKKMSKVGRGGEG